MGEHTVKLLAGELLLQHGLVLPVRGDVLDGVLVVSKGLIGVVWDLVCDLLLAPCQQCN